MIASIYEITALKRLKESLKVKNHQLEEAFQLTKSQMQVYSRTEPLVSFQSKYFIDKFRIKEEDYTHVGGDVYRVDWNACVHKYIEVSNGRIKNVCDKIEQVINGEIETFEVFDKFIYFGAGDEREYYYRLAGSLQPDGQLLMVLTDVTTNFELDKELDRIKKMFNNTLESANVGSFYIDIVNNPGKIYAEDVTANLLGIKQEKDNMYKFDNWFEGLMKSNVKSEDIRARYQKVFDGEIDDCEFTFERMVNGKKRFIRSIITNIQRDKLGNPLFIPGVFVDVTKLVESERKVFEQQIVDVVTGGYNRNKFISDLEDGRFDDKFVAIGNINKFQHVNDFYGHEVGDWFLRTLSRMLEFDGRFSVYRIGADIFALVACKETSYEEFQDIITALEQGIFSREIGVNFVTNITFACFENLDLFSSSEASVYSEKAIYKARENNKKTIYVTEDFMGSITNDLIVNYKLVNAVKDKDLFPYFQPIHDVKTGKVYAVEILARWANDGEIVSAFRFIDAINRLKIIDLLDMQMLEKAHQFYDRLIAHNERNKKISYTFNASKLSLIKFAERKDQWEELITNGSIPKDKLILELTEEIKIDDEIKESINWMNEHNLYVAVDDYGSGESNISSLADPIIDFVKLDMSVLPKDRFDEKKNLILESFVSMFHKLGKVVCIEGVESEEQLEIVKSYNIELAQGYYFSKPLSGDKLIEYLDSYEEL
jgi:diguanylate cyclase (GGDEF)-like protein